MTETLKGKLKSCRLVGIEEQYRRIVSEAKDEDWSYERFFETLLDESIAVRENNRFQRLTKQAKFSTLKTMEQFDFMKAPYLSKKEIMSFMDVKFIEDHANLLFLGSPGTGKTHIAIALGVEACRQCFKFSLKDMKEALYLLPLTSNLQNGLVSFTMKE